MKKPQAPCLGCKDRSETCHVECYKYNSYLKEQKAFKEHVTKQKIEGAILNEIDEKRFKKP